MRRWIVLALGLLAALAAVVALSVRWPDGGPDAVAPSPASRVPPASANPAKEEIGEESREALRDILREADEAEERRR